MEININCDLGEKSKFHSIENDPALLDIVNSANVACGYHAGDNDTMRMVVQISKKNGVSIGAHPSFNDPENFGRKRMNLNSSEISKLIKEENKIDIKPSMIQPVEEIKALGKFKVKISLHSEVDAEITINVSSADTIQ